MFSDSEVFLIGQLHQGSVSMRRTNISSKTDVWAKEMEWGSTYWYILSGITALNSDSSKVYTLSVIHDSSSPSLIFATVNSATGDLESKVHQSSESCSIVDDMRINGDKVYMLAYCSVTRVLVYDSNKDRFERILNSLNERIVHFAYDSDGAR